MATLRLLFAGGLFCILVVSCQASDCPYGKYWDPNFGACRECSPCPRDAILGQGVIVKISMCSQYDSLCPNWCSEETQTWNPNEGRDACPPTTPTPPVPSVNVTMSERKYNTTANRYSVMCTISFINMPTPTLEWFNPSGQLLAPTDTWGEATTQEIIDDQEIVSTLLTKEFEKGDEGQYTCASQGVPTANQTVFLEYVDPPTSPPTTISVPGSTQGTEHTTPKGDESGQPEGGLSVLFIIGIAVLVLLSVCLMVCLAFVCVKRRLNQPRGRRLHDSESHPLNDFNNGLTLETSDFKSAKIRGIAACLDLPDCVAVIIKKNGNKIKRVESSMTREDIFFIETMQWDDSIEIWMEYAARCNWIKCFCRDIEKIKTLKMNCLKISNITGTSVSISCPNVKNKFYLHYEEKNSPSSSSSAETIEGGSREIRDLRPSTEYSVQLGNKGQTGDSREFIWIWKEEFSTEDLRLRHTSTRETLTLTWPSVPSSLPLCYTLNQEKQKEMAGSGNQFPIKISHLIPDMEQVLKIRERGTTAPRHLQEIMFKTQGPWKDGGDYKGYATTDCEGPEPDGNRGRLNGRTNKCVTGLLEAVHSLRDKDATDCTRPEPETPVLEAAVNSLKEFFKDYNKLSCNNVYRVVPKKSFLFHIEDFVKINAMQDYTGVFDFLKRFSSQAGAQSPVGVSYAEKLLDAHDGPTCRFCKHAVFLLKRRTPRTDPQQSNCI
ncbi:uncharacterized protein LOC129261392 isoform X3 [Lytechinus pictus]|uniref:uncharacterized protein LOC129261392 isoform X3 n=1 Tax=Lytechinus pictus TaxID=7653 RepID=UPI0030BA189C